MNRVHALTEELRRVNRDAAQNPHRLVGRLPELSAFHRVQAQGALTADEQVHFILHVLIPDYLDRLPTGVSCRGIRQLFMWRDEGGEVQSLQTRYVKASRAMGIRTSDFGKRYEPKLTGECASFFSQFDLADRLGSRRPAPPEGPAWRTDDESSASGAPGGLHAPGADVAALARDARAAGIVAIHPRLEHDRLAARIRRTEAIAILNTWIPEINMLEGALIDALGSGARVRILMLHPDSHAVSLRSAGLPGMTRTSGDRVRLGIKQCLDVLGNIAGAIDDGARARLEVRLYDSLPSLSIYILDDVALVSAFLHGRLASEVPQLEIAQDQTLLGAAVGGELEWVWNSAWAFEDVRRWADEIGDMRPIHEGITS